MYKNIDVVMLPTKEKSGIVKNNGVNKLYFEEGLEYKDDEYQHLYFISNEEIKVGDWCICSDYRNSYQKLGKVSHVGSPGNFKNTIQIGGNTDLHIGRENLNYCKKIIATNDKSLGLPQPSQEFLEA